MRSQWKHCAAWVAAFVMSAGAADLSFAQTITGSAIAADGDSLVVSGQRVRLVGIDAPEHDQTCQKDAMSWACGQAAKEQLVGLIAGRQVECQGQGADRHGRILAVCSAGRDELNRTMVTQGWAMAYRQYSDAYVAEEYQAKTNGLGIWSSEFTAPSDYRRSKQPQPTAAVRVHAQRQPYSSSGACLIKGNHSRRGEWIYHLPGMPYYAETRPEAMFCTENEAVAAGYRRSKAAN